MFLYYLKSPILDGYYAAQAAAAPTLSINAKVADRDKTMVKTAFWQKPDTAHAHRRQSEPDQGESQVSSFISL